MFKVPGEMPSPVAPAPAGVKSRRQPGRQRTRRWRAGITILSVLSLAVGAGTLGSSAGPAAAIPVDPTQNPCANTTGTLSLSSHSVVAGQSITLSGTVTPPAGCVVTAHLLYRPDIPGSNTASNPGSTVTPPASGTYVLRMFSNGFYYELASDTVQVTLPIVNGHPLASITRGDQAPLLAQAARVPNAVIAIRSDVDLDMSREQPIPVAPGVQIIGRRDTAHPSGPRLFTTTYPRPLLSIGEDGGAPSDNVRITGLRFDGGESSDPCDEAGSAHIDADAIQVFSSQHIEIDHSEFYRWNGSAVNVLDPSKRINRENYEVVRIHDNYIHDNQHPTYCGIGVTGTGGHGGGYGVNTARNAFAYIADNVFSDNRHSLASSGSTDSTDPLARLTSTGSGYVASGNLFFSPGIDSVTLEISTNANHQIDAHGQDTCPDLSSESYNCGPVGEFYSLFANTVVGRKAYPNAAAAIQLRGTPTSFDPNNPNSGMSVVDNAFAQPAELALTQTQSGLMDAGFNHYSAPLQSFYDLSNDAPCDFDGDSVADPFRASGVAWWYYSSFAHRWVHQAIEDRPVSMFADSNGDGLCDARTTETAHITQPLLESFAVLTTTVPKVIGADQSTAANTLAPAGLLLGTVTSRLSTYPVGSIVAENPSTGSDAPVGSAVDIVVSSGPGATVPNVLGWDKASARSAITAAGLTVGTLSSTNNCVDPGTVQLQDPAGDAFVALGSPVTLSISTCTTTGGGGGGGKNPPQPK